MLFVGESSESRIMPSEFSTTAFRLMHLRARDQYRVSGTRFRRFRTFDIGSSKYNMLGGSPWPNSMKINWNWYFGSTNGLFSFTQQGRLMVSSVEMTGSARARTCGTGLPLLGRGRSADWQFCTKTAVLSAARLFCIKSASSFVV